MSTVLKDFVIESSTTTGTGDITVTGAVWGLRAFSSVCSVGDKMRVVIKAVDSAGLPTGQFEICDATYSAANTITRDTVLDSSNGGALVNFSAGTKHVYMGFDANRATWQRERLFAARTYYVRTDGSDSNTGLANSSGGAFLTVQKAIDVASALDNNGYDITIRVVAGTYTGSNTLKSFIGSGSILIRGDTADLTSTIISTTSADCFTNLGNGHYGTYKLEYLKLQTTTSGKCIYVGSFGMLKYQNVAFGACASEHIQATGDSTIVCTGNYTINGSAGYHFAAYYGGKINVSGVTITVSGTPAFSGIFAYSWGCSAIYCSGNTFSGSATGKRYAVDYPGLIFTNGGGANYFPGNSAGTTSNGGVYA